MTRGHRLPPLAATLAVSLFASACKVGPDYVPPEIEVPPAWQATDASLQSDLQRTRRWWQELRDPTLTALIEQAERANPGLNVAVQRIQEARALRGVVRGDLWPDIDGIGSYRRIKTSRNGTNTQVAGFQFQERDLWTIGGELNWELDLWGRVRRGMEAARAEIEASIEDFRDVLVLLQAEIAATWLEHELLDDRIAVLESNIGLQRRTLAEVEQRFAADLVPEIDVTQARTTLAATRADLPRLLAQRRLAANRLAILVGELPGGVDAMLAAGRGIPDIPAELGVAIPAEVMRQRPDVRRAERRLAAATARIGVASAELYPRFSLFGSFTWEAQDFDRVFAGTSESFAVGPQLRWNLFHGGRLYAAIDVEDARAAQALAEYERTVLRAAEEVEAALETHRRELERLAALDEAVAAAERSAELVENLYESGVADFDRVLDAQTALLSVQDLRVRSRAALATNVVMLYRALGGGWIVESDPALVEAVHADG